MSLHSFVLLLSHFLLTTCFYKRTDNCINDKNNDMILKVSVIVPLCHWGLYGKPAVTERIRIMFKNTNIIFSNSFGLNLYHEIKFLERKELESINPIDCDTKCTDDKLTLDFVDLYKKKKLDGNNAYYVLYTNCDMGTSLGYINNKEFESIISLFVVGRSPLEFKTLAKSIGYTLDARIGEFNQDNGLMMPKVNGYKEYVTISKFNSMRICKFIKNKITPNKELNGVTILAQRVQFHKDQIYEFIKVENNNSIVGTMIKVILFINFAFFIFCIFNCRRNSLKRGYYGGRSRRGAKLTKGSGSTKKNDEINIDAKTEDKKNDKIKEKSTNKKKEEKSVYKTEIQETEKPNTVSKRNKKTEKTKNNGDDG